MLLHVAHLMDVLPRVLGLTVFTGVCYLLGMQSKTQPLVEGLLQLVELSGLQFVREVALDLGEAILHAVGLDVDIFDEAA